MSFGKDKGLAVSSAGPLVWSHIGFNAAISVVYCVLSSAPIVFPSFFITWFAAFSMS